VVVAKLGLQLRFGFRDFEIAWTHPSVRSAKEPFVLPMVKTKSTVIGCVVIPDTIRWKTNILDIVRTMLR
jgi:hypothetical protein